MNILTEIHRSPGINVNGRTIHRTAVRGVILQGKNLLMIHSANVGDYKFPGGGVGEGESHDQALRREVQEESGLSVRCVGLEIGAIVEYDRPIENNYDLFQMISHYYLCDVAEGFGPQALDAYEQELGFEPVWIDIDTALQLNKALLHADNAPEWLRREIFVLEYLWEELTRAPTT